MNAIVKYIDSHCVTHYHWLGSDFSFEVSVFSGYVFVTINRKNFGDVEEKVIEFEIEFDLDDIHDYLVILLDEDSFEEKVCMEVENEMGDAIEDYLASEETILDLNEVSHNISVRISAIAAEFVEKFHKQKADDMQSEG